MWWLRTATTSTFVAAKNGTCTFKVVDSVGEDGENVDDYAKFHIYD